MPTMTFLNEADQDDHRGPQLPAHSIYNGPFHLKPELVGHLESRWPVSCPDAMEQARLDLITDIYIGREGT